MAEEPIKRHGAPQILLAIAALLIPFIGGQIPTDRPLPLAPGMGELMKSIFGGPFTQGFETPLLSHLVIGLLIASAMAISLIQRSVIQIPTVRLTATLIAFFGLLFISVGLSAFRFVSMASLSEWLLFALTFFTAVATLGRKDGPRLVLACLFIGICLLALYGIAIEYGEMRRIDPTYRIFAGWVNPNATAGIFLIGLCIGVGLIPSLPRGAALIAGIGGTLIATAFFLTGSKAGFGAILVSVATFAVLAGVWSLGKNRLQRPLAALAILILGFALFTTMQKANQAQATTGGPGLGRMANFGDTQAQSLGFRKLLWQGSLDLTMKRPIGFGLGTYRFEGSRPGLTTQTQLAHNNILQLAVETSWLGPIALLVALIVWLLLMFRGARSMPEESNLMRTGIIAAIIGTFAHGIFESNLYYSGIGLTFFLLMGVGLCLSADSVAPEFTPKGVRAGLSLLCLLPILMLAYFGYLEYQRAMMQHAIQSRDLAEALKIANHVVGIAPIDGDTWNTISLLDPAQREAAIQQAATVMPSPRILRNLAKFEQSRGKFASAEGAVNLALVRDPNNLNTLTLGLDISKQFGEADRAKYYADRMVAVESTDYYKIRSLPQMVETATVEARIYLANSIPEPKEKASMLEPALIVLSQYAATTVPEVKKFAADGGGYLDETPAKAIEKCQLGIQIAKQLAKIYRGLGETDKAASADGMVGDFAAAIESLDGTK